MTAKKKAASTARKRSSASSSRTESRTSRRSISDHSEHPEHEGDPTVRHARPVGGAGFPQGEYDVVEPAKRGAKPTSVKDTLLQQHYAAGGLDVDAIEKAIKHPNANRLSATDRELALELMPVGALLEHEAQNRWRVHVAGQNRYGHGSTAKEAVESWVLGNDATTVEAAGVKRFQALPKSVQSEIQEREEALPEDQRSSTTRQIAESVRNSNAANARKQSPSNAGSDGAEVASAINAAGRGQSPNAADQGSQSRAKAARNRSGARRRSGGKAKK